MNDAFDGAAMVAAERDLGTAPWLRGETRLDAGHGAVVGARLRVTAHGLVEAWLGGARVDDDVLTPGWSSYEWRLRYREHDVTDRVAAAAAAGEPVVVALLLGKGWYCGRLGFFGNSAVYGSRPAGLARLEVTFADGHVQVDGTGAGWRAGPSHVLADDLYDGQTTDLTRAGALPVGPGTDVGDPAGWCGVEVVERDPATLVPYLGPVVRRQRTVPVREVTVSPSGRTLVDVGENLVGWLRLRVRGERGAVVTVRHAEVLEDGDLCTRPLRTARATDTYVLTGGDDVLEPSFSVHGFRYADVDGLPGPLAPDAVEAVVVRSDLERTGTFACSDPLLDALHANVVRSLEGNAVDLPTDCPQRDERLGWTGDIAVFAPTAAYLFDVGPFLDDWLADLGAETAAAGGRVPHVVPDNVKYDQWPAHLPVPDTAAIWSDAAVWVPWTLWRAYADRAALARQWPAALAHTRRVAGLLSPDGLWDSGFQFGDWLDPTAPPDQPWAAKADRAVVATACAARTFALAAELARALDHAEEAAGLDALHVRTAAAFVEHYVDADGTVRSDCQTVYALAVVFGLLDGDPRREAAGRRLAALVEQADHTVVTGFAGTPFVLDALTVTGHLDAAYRMLLQTRCPSWLYPVTMGATTIWERWDSMLPDGRVNPGEMTSFNHYAFGSVADWMHRTIGGITLLEPGGSRVLVAPRPGGGLTWATASLRTPHGTVRCSWRLDADGALQVDVEAPPGVEIVREPT